MMNNLKNPLIFIGSGRSGTTIISEIVFRHESLAWPSNYQVLFPGVPKVNLLRRLFDNKFWHLQGQKQQLNEVSKFNKYFFKPAEAYPFWEHITGKRIDFSRGFLLNEKATPEECERIRTAFSRLVHYQGRQRLAFKITGPSRIGYLTSIFPDAVFINIVRDAVPTIKSWLNVDFWQDKGKHQLWWEGAYSKEEEAWAKQNSDQPELLGALQYKKLMDVTNEEIRTYKVKCLTVRYEDFVQDPATEIHRIMDFADLNLSAAVENYLSKLKIYNQNAAGREGKDSSKYHSELLQQILKGQYSFG